MERAPPGLKQVSSQTVWAEGWGTVQSAYPSDRATPTCCVPQAPYSLALPPHARHHECQAPTSGGSPVLIDLAVELRLWTEKSKRAVSLPGKVYVHGKYSSDECRVWPRFILPHTYSEVGEKSLSLKRELADGRGGHQSPAQAHWSWKRPFSFHGGKKPLYSPEFSRETKPEKYIILSI